MNSLVLSLFPGIGLLDSAFELEGYCVLRGPDPIWGGDIRRFNPPAGHFDGVIGGPPCQSFSSLVHLVRANGYEPRFGNLIPEFERCVAEAQPAWFLMENVPAAPEPVVVGYGVKSFLLDNSSLDAGDGFGHEQRRVRRFSFGMRGVDTPPSLLRWIDLAVFLLPDAAHRVTAMHDSVDNLNEWSKTRKSAVVGDLRETPVAIGGSGKPKQRQRTVTKLGPDHLAKLAATTERTRKGIAAVGHGEPPGVRDAKRRHAVSAGGSGQGAQRPNGGDGQNGRGGRYKFAEACRLQGLQPGFLDDAPFTADGKLKAVANGVPISMGRAIAKAIRKAIANE